MNHLFNLFGTVTIACAFGHTGLLSTLAQAAEKAETPFIERYYFIKGMTCGGCVFGVKKALERIGIQKNQILEVDYRAPDPKNQIGHAKVRFEGTQYKGLQTDCKIAKEVKSNPGYVLFWDKAEPDPCRLEPKTN